MRWPIIIGCVVALGACGSGKSDKKPTKAKPTTDAKAKAEPVVADAGAKTGPRKISLPKAPPVPPAPRGLPETPSPKYNPTTPNKVMLGRMLFFDKRLSSKKNVSCDTCHIPEYGWSDRRPRSPTANGKLNLRHTPTLNNIGYVKLFRWDGYTNSLEAFIEVHWRGQYATLSRDVMKRLRRIPEYRAHFARSFDKRGITPKLAIAALSAFVRTIRSGNSPWDKYELDNDEKAVSKSAIAGAKLFRDTAQCGTCHPPPHYMDNLFHNKGIGMGIQIQDRGRAHVTKDDKDTGAFRTPTLRGITRTAPYFHDGSAESLAKAVGFSLSGGFRTNNPHIDPKLQPITLSAGQQADLLAFLKALTPAATGVKRPVLPPDPK